MHIYIHTCVYMQVLRSFVCAPLVLVISVVLLHHNALGYLIFCVFFLRDPLKAKYQPL